MYVCAYESVWGATLLLHSNTGEGIALRFAFSQKHGIKNHLAAGMSPSALSWERSSVRGFQACSVPPSTRWREASCCGKLPVSFVCFKSILDAGASLLFPGAWEAAFLQQFRASRDSVPTVETVSTGQKRHCILRERLIFFSPFMQVARTCKTRKTINLGWKPLTFAYVLRVWVCILPVTPFLHSLDLVYCLASVYSRLFLQFCKPSALCWVLGTQGQIGLMQHWWICRAHMEP